MNRPKSIIQRGAALLLSAALALTLTPVAGASEALGTELRKRTADVARGVTVTEQSLWSATFSDLRTEHYATYIPGGSVRPVVAYGNSVTDRRSLSAMAAALEGQGMRVAAGINAGFYVVNNGTPVGLVVSGGRIRSSGENFNAIGFRADGSAIIGAPSVTMTAQWSTPDRIEENEEGAPIFVLGQARSINISGFNKIREDGGYYLFSDEFAATTKNNVAGTDVVLRPQGEFDPFLGLTQYTAGLPLSGSVSCVVEAVRPSTPDNSIPAGCFVLSMNRNSGEEKLAVLSELQPGNEVTLTVQTEGEWSQVVEAVSGLYSLVENGAVAEGAPTGRNPYTAVGLRPDGGVVFYTIDGRQSGYSVGASYTQVSQRLIELGCVTAIAMDGGGSTAFGETTPADSAFRVTNRGSDGSARAVSTCLFLAQPVTAASGVAGQLYISAGSDVVLAGGSLPLRVTAADTEGFPMAWSGELSWQAEQGTVIWDEAGGWTYIPRSDLAENVTDVITVTSGGLTGTFQVVAVASPSAIRVIREETGTAVAALRVKPGEQVELSAASSWRNLPVAGGNDSLYVWAVSPEVGSVDASGCFIAGEEEGAGTLTVTKGGCSVQIEVTVERDNPFADCQNHWSKDYTTELYRRGIANGELGEDGRLYFYPDRAATRGELCVMMVRMLGVDTAQYGEVELPFVDAGTVPDWMLPYIQSAFALGIVNGSDHGDGLYVDISVTMNRETAMTILGRTLGVTREADLSGFADSGTISGWARPHVETLVAMGVVHGGEGLLRPMDSIARGELAKIIIESARLLESGV